MGDTSDKVKGNIKEGAGKATGNERLEREGELDQAKGKVKDAVEDTKDAVNKLLR